MQQNISDAVRYLEENSKLLPEWFQPNHMMINLGKCHFLLRGIDMKSIIVGNYFSIKSPNNENYKGFSLVSLSFLW